MTLENEKQKFNLIAKRILKRELSENPETLSKYKVDIVQAYNTFLDYVSRRIIQLTPTQDDVKDIYVETTKKVKDVFIRCLDRLKLSYDFTDRLFERIDASKLVVVLESEQDQGESDQERILSGSDSETEQDQDLNDMAPTAMEFMNAYVKLIPEFDGNVNKLQSVIDALELLNSNVGDHGALAVSIIKSRLTGKARVCILDSDDSVKKIIDRLKSEIKGETSEAIIAKIHNVKQKDKSANKYVKEIEELNDLLKASYISEGLTPALANKYSTQQVVLAMKHNASNDKVKFVMEAGKFETVDEAVAKFISTSNEATSQGSVMFVSQNNSSKFDRKRFSNNFNQNRGSGNYKGNNYRGNGGRGYNGRYQNDSYNSANYGRGNYRGRGYRRGNYGNNYQDRERVRRIEDQGNAANPQLLTLGELSGQGNQRN